MFSGMNVNKRETLEHVEFEPNTYPAAFSMELKAIVRPMGSLVSHLSDPGLVVHTKQVLSSCLRALQLWFTAINFTNPNVVSILSQQFWLKN
jgi:E3 ubiquitin-protein ligase UBR3